MSEYKTITSFKKGIYTAEIALRVDSTRAGPCISCGKEVQKGFVHGIPITFSKGGERPEFPVREGIEGLLIREDTDRIDLRLENPDLRFLYKPGDEYQGQFFSPDLRYTLNPTTKWVWYPTIEMAQEELEKWQAAQGK